ncbi:MAG: class I SAM-dependent methyltransferase [Micavibrio sp.]|nr:class I SAM-dependent methyltransferase [Micavibrio sp.]
MHGINPNDPGNIIDWGKTSADYAVYRNGQPDSFFERMRAMNIGLRDQVMLDLGTGTGALARRYAQRGAAVSGIDPSEGQIEAAKKLAQAERLNIDFRVGVAESLPFDSHSFDVVTANQCWLYFDANAAIRQVKWALKDGGLLVTSHCSWLPVAGSVAQKTEALVLAHNPNWTAAGWDGFIPPMPYWAEGEFRLRGMFYYDEEIPFTHDSWRGRIRACRGVGAVMDEGQVEAFDAAHAQMLKDENVPESFGVLHRIDAHILEPL